MGRIFGILLIVLGLWLGLRLVSGGPEGPVGGSGDAVEAVSAPRRAGAAVESAHAQAAARREALLRDE